MAWFLGHTSKKSTVRGTTNLLYYYTIYTIIYNLQLAQDAAQGLNTNNNIIYKYGRSRRFTHPPTYTNDVKITLIYHDHFF